MLAGDQTLKEHKKTLETTKNKVAAYMRKQFIDLNMKARARKTQLKSEKKSGGPKVEEIDSPVNDVERKGLSELIDFLLSVDKDLPAADFYGSHAEELFNILFKLTWYNDDQFAIANDTDLSMRILPHEELRSKVEAQPLAEARVNLIVNNLLTKQIVATKEANEDMRQKMLVQVAELLFTDDAPKSISTRRLAKVMVYSALLLR